MTEAEHETDHMRAEAARWVARLNSLPVSTDTLRDFFAWWRVEGHPAAYDEVASVWDAAAVIANRPAMQALADEALQRGGRRRFLAWARPRVMAVSAFAVACIVASVNYTMSAQYGYETYATRVGEQSIVTLDDGSRVALDTDTEVRVRFTQARREVELVRGQAFFTVAHKRARPFVVDTDHTDVFATGTQFNVRRTGQGVDVTLIEGSVQVTPSRGPATHLATGEQFSLGAGGTPQIRRVDTTSVTAWRQGRIVLHDTTLSDAIAEVNRYARKPIKLDAESFGQERVGGSFATGDVDSFVAAVTATLPLKPVTTSDASIHLTVSESNSSLSMQNS